MMTPIKKAAGGYHTTTATTSASHQVVVYPSRRTHFLLSYYIDSKQYKPHEPYTPFFYGENDGLPDALQHLIEGMKFQICRVTHPSKPRKPSSRGLAGQRTDRLQYRAVKPRDTIHVGAQHTTKQAGNLPDSEVFSRSEFESVLTFQRSDGYGAGSAYPQGRQHNLFCVLKPSPTLCPQQADGGFSVQQGTEFMTTVNTPTTPKTGNTTPLIRQQAIENALNMALFHVRKGDTHRAVAKSIRAASMLKQACAEAQIGGAA